VFKRFQRSTFPGDICKHLKIGFPHPLKDMKQKIEEIIKKKKHKEGKEKNYRKCFS
jgi:CRISPR/Cas system-associated endoribonuclease Cas2